MKWTLGIVALLAAADLLSARTVLHVNTEDGKRVDLRVECCFDNLPPCGYAPVEITVNNSSGRARTWRIRSTSPSYSFGPAGDNVQSSGAFTVEPSATRTMKLLVPISPPLNFTPNSTVNIVISGYGIAGEDHQFLASIQPNGKPTTPAMAVSQGASRALNSLLQKTADAHGQQLRVSAFEAPELPEDWRALIGFSGLWLTDAEWNELSPPQRTAVEDWVALGGKLFFCTKGTPLPAEKKGMGSIQEFDPTRIFQEWKEMAPRESTVLTADDVSRWPARASVGILTPNLPLLIGFLGLFAAIVGPFNLFMFAKGGRRSRLFWTTPLISLGASLLLFVIILVQDGFGGSGVQNAVICLVPSARKAVVFQEQLSRTGMLTSSDFAVADPAWISLINSDASRRTSKSFDLQTEGTDYAGDWFKSRTVQAQWIESIIPTRGEVTLVNPEEAAEQRVAPIVVSSIAAPLSELWFWDAHGDAWGALNVRTGVKTTLARMPGPGLLLSQARIPLRGKLEPNQGTRGSFIALTSDPEAFIHTLPSIRWENRRAVYLGPVTGFVAPGENPAPLK